MFCKFSPASQRLPHRLSGLVFEEYTPLPQRQNLLRRPRSYIKQTYYLPSPTDAATVWICGLERTFGKEARYIHTWIVTELFYPESGSSRSRSSEIFLRIYQITWCHILYRDDDDDNNNNNNNNWLSNMDCQRGNQCHIINMSHRRWYRTPCTMIELPITIDRTMFYFIKPAKKNS